MLATAPLALFVEPTETLEARPLSSAALGSVTSATSLPPT